ncbi:MAG: hypothetical protein CVV22_12510 [Ignavibacteriae bacterium HGW-Ignavibacteriae-1]|jgi:hypothetical protein|nr:MAG: hypothetical protein CVV22_12510 [Ignavibacteriae bacterium HGW-Ignavibacteriae-1]
MDDISIFPHKESEPTDEDLKLALGESYDIWTRLNDFVLERYPKGILNWNYPGKKWGWNYRIKDKKRAIIYFLPRESYFKVGLVFGQKAFDMIMDSDISEEIKNELQQATKYAEGRGIRIDVKNDKIIPDIMKLVEIKLLN